MRTNEPLSETLAGDISHVCLAMAKVEHFFQSHNRSPQHLTKFNLSHHKGRMFFPFYHPILQDFYKNSTLLAIYQQLKGDSIPTHYEEYTKHIRRITLPSSYDTATHKQPTPTKTATHQAQKNPHLSRGGAEGRGKEGLYYKFFSYQSIHISWR